jgi:hypothetical protein
MLKCGMLGASDTPFEGLEHRRHQYSGKCANANVYDYLCQHLYEEKKREEIISAHMSSEHDEKHTYHQHHNASPYHRPQAYHLHEPQT